MNTRSDWLCWLLFSINYLKLSLHTVSPFVLSTIKLDYSPAVFNLVANFYILYKNKRPVNKLPLKVYQV